MYIKLYLYFLTFLSFEHGDKGNKGAKDNKGDKDDIVVIGIAIARKAGAAVQSIKNKGVYFIDDLNYWESDVVGKTVKVSGKLVIENYEQTKEITQQIVGTVYIIKKPKWEIVK
jgi:hypothetical protein